MESSLRQIPHTEYLSQQDWDGTQEFAIATSFQVMLLLPGQNHTAVLNYVHILDSWGKLFKKITNIGILSRPISSECLRMGHRYHCSFGFGFVFLKVHGWFSFALGLRKTGLQNVYSAQESSGASSHADLAGPPTAVWEQPGHSPQGLAQGCQDNSWDMSERQVDAKQNWDSLGSSCM